MVWSGKMGYYFFVLTVCQLVEDNIDPVAVLGRGPPPVEKFAQSPTYPCLVKVWN